MVTRQFRDEVAARTRSVNDLFHNLGQAGRGTYGIVYKCYRRSEGSERLYALKGMRSTMVNNDGFSMAACREISLLRELKHENVIRAQEVILCAKTREVWFTFPYAEYDLYSILTHHRPSGRDDGRRGLPPKAPAESLQKSVMWQVLNGIHYLHSNWVLHRDMKPANILVMGTGPEHGIVKIGDMGMARLFRAPLKPLTDVDPVVVTFWYRSPELLLGARHYTKAVDMWSIGCIMAELMTAKPIFWVQASDNNSQDPFHKDQLRTIFSKLGFPKAVSTEAKSDRDWENMESMPHYKRMMNDTDFDPQRFARAPGIEFIVAQCGHCPPSKTRLLTNLIRIDPRQRTTAQQALKSKYFQEEPLPQRNVFAGLRMEYPIREIKEVKDGKIVLDLKKEPKKEKPRNVKRKNEEPQ